MGYAGMIFGTGLIGGEVLRNLSCFSVCSQWKFNWKNSREQSEELELIKDQIVTIIKNNSLNVRNLAIIWCAGKAGFLDSLSCFEDEWISFQKILSLTCQLRDYFPNIGVHFHLVSSAGGLFEGKTYVNTDTLPSPNRPYGIVKLNQENYLINNTDGIEITIYRPSSVYGLGKLGSKTGLIPVLMKNAIQQKVSLIFGNSSTLRDYVSNYDVGSFIAQQVLLFRKTISGVQYHHLVSTRSYSIFEIIHKIELLINRKLYIMYQEDTNSADNSYLNSTVSSLWKVNPLEINIHKMYMYLIQHKNSFYHEIST